MKKELIFKILTLTCFGIAMAYLESAVVVYLRQLWYPNGFEIPFYPYFFYFGYPPNLLKPVPLFTYLIELGREAATIIMLAAVGMLAGKRLIEKAAFFFFTFGIWDIFYYIFLFITLRWPPSLLTMDLLFLIPVPWLAPVFVPITASSIVIIASIYILNRD